ncbi:hypothetical protein KFE25_012777 [Diacronema lutheri]|uniref:Amine oxidase domain-containing protein n=1 Tax=Diacronema lutheri TaxID=2081491 RepID=A0A8J5XCE5_DIALT|nr:hypothetical protein KFE25_012777 [Diacronema lutheri]
MRTVWQHKTELALIERVDATVSRAPIAFGGERRFVGGTAAVARGLLVLALALAPAMSADLVAHCTFMAARLSGGWLEVATRDPRIGFVAAMRARTLVLAAPPALVRARARFEPPLPRSIADVQRRAPTWMTNTAKLALSSEAPFWRDAGLSGGASSLRGPPLLQTPSRCCMDSSSK